MTKFAIKTRTGKKFFAGFGQYPDFAPIWTANLDDAMTGDRAWAKGQALCMICAGNENIQQKPVAV
jgi:hypothetical protein